MALCAEARWGMFSPLCFRLWSPVVSQAADQGAYLPGASGVGAQAADRGTHQPGGFGPVCPGSLVTDLGVHGPGLQVCAGAASPMFTVQVLRG